VLSLPLVDRFVGRARELVAADAFVESVRAGRGGVLLVCGDPGAGKSRFLREVAGRAASEGVRFHCGPATAGVPRADVIEQMAREGPVVLLLDDLPRADEATLAMLRGPAGVIATVCADAGPAWPAFVGAMRAAGLVQVLDLPPLTDGEVRAMLPDGPPGFADAIVAAARGNPRRATGLVNALARRGRIAPGGAPVSRVDLLDVADEAAAPEPVEVLTNSGPAKDEPFDPRSRAVAFMKATGACVLRHRLYPQWCRPGDNADRDVLEAARLMLEDGRPRTIALRTPVLCVDDVPLDTRRHGEVAWEFAKLLRERLAGSVTVSPGIEEREVAVFVAELSATVHASRLALTHWTELLNREGATHLQVAQQQYFACDDGETVDLVRGDLVGRAALEAAHVDQLGPVLRKLRAAVDQLREHQPDHRPFVDALVEVTDATAALCREARVVTFEVQGDGLSVNGQALADPDGHAAWLRQALLEHGLRALTVKDGLMLADVAGIASVLAVRVEAPEWKRYVESILACNPVRRFAFSQRETRVLPVPNAVPSPTPVPEKRRPEQAAGALLGAPLESLVTDASQVQFCRALQALEGGEHDGTSASLTARLVDAMRHPQAEVRHGALGLLRRALRELKAARLGWLLARTSGAMAARVFEETDPGLGPTTLVETMRFWLSVAILSGQASLAARLVREGVVPALESTSLGVEFRSQLQSKLRSVGQEAGAPLLVLLQSAEKETRDDAVLLLGLLGTPLTSTLLKLVLDSEDGDVRSAAAKVLAAVGGRGAKELAASITPSMPAEKARHVLEACDYLPSDARVEGLTRAALHGDASVTNAAFERLRRCEERVALQVGRRLVDSGATAAVHRVLQAAANRDLRDLTPSVVRLAQLTEVEEMARDCCEFLQIFPTPAAVPALKRIFENRPRLMGLMRGFSDGVRAAAVKAAARIAGPSASELLKAAQKDPSPAVRGAVA